MRERVRYGGLPGSTPPLLDYQSQQAEQTERDARLGMSRRSRWTLDALTSSRLLDANDLS